MYQESTYLLLDMMTYRDLAAKKLLALPDMWTTEGEIAFTEYWNLCERVEQLEAKRHKALQQLKRRHGIID